MKYEKQIPDKRRKIDKSGYIRLGITAFLVLAASIFVVFLFVKAENVNAFVTALKSVLTPVFYGAIIAYLLNPIVNFLDERLSGFLQKHLKKQTRAKKISKVVSIIVTVIFALSLVTALFYLIVPEVSSTISVVVNELPGQVDNFLKWFDGLLQEQTQIGEMLQRTVKTVTIYVEDFIENQLVDQITGMAEYLLSGVWGVVNVVYNIVLGIVFSIYMLSSKDKFSAQAKKITYAVFNRRNANSLIRTARNCHRIFTGAISGKILDSAIIGVLCFVGMTLIGLPYTVLIATVIGVTNVIPFFGPYIGAIPSALLILFVDPLQCLYFIIFIVLLQQFDCNFLDPRIVGGSVGLSAFWVLFACILFGGLFGLPGMVLGVPTFACIYTIVKEILEKRLKKKGLMTATDDYASVDAVPEEDIILTDAEYESTAEISEAGQGIEEQENACEPEAGNEPYEEDELESTDISKKKVNNKKENGGRK